MAGQEGQFARRQWSLADNPKLKYKWLQAFDVALMGVVKQLNDSGYHYVSIDEQRRLVSYVRDGHLFVTNLSPDASYVDHDIPAFDGGYGVVLSSDGRLFGGQGRIDTRMKYQAYGNKVKLYIPSRVGIVLGRLNTTERA